MNYTYINLFFVYAFIGYIWEIIWVSAGEKKLTNRGFLRGPILPIYGFGVIAVIFATRKLKDKFLIFLVGMFTSTALELVAGFAIEKIFKIRYWNYDKRFLNFKGYICLRSSLFWGFVSIFLNDITYKFIMPYILIFQNSSYYHITNIAIILFLLDLYVSIRDALSYRQIIEMEEKIDVYKKIIRDNINEKKEDLDQRIDRIRDRKVSFGKELESSLDTFTYDYLIKVIKREQDSKKRSISIIKDLNLSNKDYEKGLIEMIQRIYDKRNARYIKLFDRIKSLSRRNKLSFRNKDK